MKVFEAFNAQGPAFFNSTVSVQGTIDVAATPSGTPAANTIYRDNIVKGWVSLNGTGTIAINDSFNCSSITDNGVGDYTVTWDRDFATAGYAAVATGRNFAVIDAKAAGSATINLYNASMAKADDSDVSIIAIGDQ